MEWFEPGLPTRVVFGNNSIDEAGKYALELGAKTAFITTDRGLVEAGHVDRLERALDRKGIEHRRFDRVQENPTTTDIDACLATVDTWQPDLWIGIGGGSSIDVAKGANLLRAGGGSLLDYWGKGLAKGQLQPMIAIPTTAGTGSEMQSFALIAQTDSHQKMACGDAQLAPKIAILDPTLTLSLPRVITIYTGLDTLGHAVESAVCKTHTEASAKLSAQALGLVVEHLPRVLSAPEDLDSRGSMMQAAAAAGAAIELSMLGAAHALANPLTAHHRIAHGHAVGIMLPLVVAFNATDPLAAKNYRQLAVAAKLCGSHEAEEHAISVLIHEINSLLQQSGIETSLTVLGVRNTDLNALADEAAGQWTAKYNPRPVSVEDLIGLLSRRT